MNHLSERLIMLFFLMLLNTSCMMNASIESLDSTTDSGQVRISRKIYLDTTQLAISEGSAAIINVAVSEKLDKDIQVNVSLNDSASRFQSIASTVTIPAQTLSKPIVLQTIDDNIYQGIQVIDLTISSSDSSISADPNSLTINLQDNDLPPVIQIADAVANENSGTIDFAVTTNRVSIFTSTFDYSTQDATALAGSDYTAVSAGHFSIPAGQTSAVIQIPLVNDSVGDPNETFNLNVSNSINASLGVSSAIGTIVDDDDVYISIADVVVLENAGNAVFNISINRTSTNNVSVDFSTSNGTAASGTNYTSASGTAIITAGSTTTTVSVPIIDTSAVCEGNRTFNVNLTSGVNGTIQDNLGVGTIQDNDLPIVSVGNVTVVESSIAAVPVSLSQACSMNVTVSYTMADGTASASDYFGMSGTFTINAGKTSAYLGVSLAEDTLVESSENFTLAISSPINATIGTSISTISITDNDVELDPVFDVTYIASAPRHMCAVRSGAAYCWGGNGNGDLGNGTTTPSYYPTLVTGLTSGVTKIVGGGLFYTDLRYSARTCAIVSGAAKCWGYQTGSGELGDGSGVSSSVPLNVSGLSSNVTDIDTSEVGTYGFSCAVHNGAAKCWGYNNVGQLGDGTTTARLTPVTVTGLSSGVISIAVGENHACATLSDGTIRCWGNNNVGQLGDGTTTSSTVPVTVSGISSGATKVSLGYRHSCALVSGGVKCWGYNNYGQLGNGTTTASTTPVDATGMTSGVLDMSTSGDAVGGNSTTCAIDSSGAVKCWGANNYGQIGDGTLTTRTVPTQVTSLTSGYTQVSVSVANVCALHNSGKAYCWGDYTVGQLSGNLGGFLYSPKDSIGMSSQVSVVKLGHNFTCAIQNGAAKCWGVNNSGQLGNGNYTNQGSPVQVTGLTSGVTAIATDNDNYYSNRHACAVHNGAVKCWGDNTNGQLGNGVTGGSSNVPVQVSGLTSGAIAVSVSQWHSCAVMNSGTVKCWGNNSHGQLGNNSTTSSNIPVDVLNISTATDVSVATRYSCVIDGGALKCWGSNANGQLGDGTTVDKLTPTQVSGLSSGVTSIATIGYDNSNSFACAVVSGSAKCWGYNYNGRLGTGTGSVTVPTQVVGFTSGVRKIDINYSGACLLTNEGAVHCWGENTSLLMAPSFAVQVSTTPLANTFFTSGVSDMSTSGGGLCVIGTAGNLKCVGSYLNAGVGLSTMTVSTPQEILFP